MESQLLSREIENPNDSLSGEFCACKHLIKEEHSFGKCYALFNRGGTLVACRCDKIREIQFSVIVSFDLGLENGTNKIGNTESELEKGRTEEKTSPIFKKIVFKKR